MGGGRNGRFLRWGFVLLVFLTMVYVFYLYRDIKGVLRDREDALENMNTLHTRMTEELKDLVKGHSELQEEVKNERVAHQRTRLDKDTLSKQCQSDLKKMKESADQEKFQLTQERDSYKQAAEDEENNYRHLQEQHTELNARYDKELVASSNENKQLRDACDQMEAQLKSQIEQYKKDSSEVHSAAQNWQQASQQCNAQLQSAQQTVDVKSMRVSTLEREVESRQREIEQLRSHLQQLQGEMANLMTSQQKVEKRELPSQPFLMGDTPPPGSRISDSKRLSLYHALQQKQALGEVLTSKEQHALQLLQARFGDGNGPDRGQRNGLYYNLPAEGGQRPEGAGFGHNLPSPYHSDMRKPHPVGGDRPPYPPPGGVESQWNWNAYQKQPPGNAAGYSYQATNQQQQQQQQQQQHLQLPQQGPQQQFPDDGGQAGMGQGQAQPGLGLGQNTPEKQQLPELAEQEEVRELQLEDQEDGQDGKAEEEGGDEGLDEQAFNPDEVRGEKEEEQEVRQYDYREDQNYNYMRQKEQQKEEEQDEAKENLNLPSPNIVQETDTDRQQIPVPDPVHVEDGKQQAPPPQPPRLENPDQGYDDYNNNKEEGREADEGEGGEKDAAYDYDDNAQKQFEADMNYDRRLHARQEKEVEGIDEVMRQRISEREMRKRQQVEGLEQQQQMEVEKKLSDQQLPGLRNNNLRFFH